MGRYSFVDLQVNGYAGVDFNQDHLTPDSLRLACQRLRDDGVAGILATIITDTVEAMQRRLRRIVELRDHDELAKKVILGLHIEGPFICPSHDFSGAHPRHAIRSADLDTMKMLLDAADGLTRIVTLAPEHDVNLAVTRMLSNQGLVVSAGHCDPSLDQLDAAIDAGLTMFTHLGNGCPMTMARHDNIIQRALFRADRLWLSFIADGIHVDFHALSNYLRLAGNHALVVTDAMSAASMGPGRYQLGRWDIEVGDDLAVWAPQRSHLVGSAMTMAQAQQNLTNDLGLSPQRVEFLLRTAPLELLGIDALATDDPAGTRVRQPKKVAQY
jgi:N-acetylglucosamine-6-phosphate deacetylase